jgi:hypothetical protein
MTESLRDRVKKAYEELRFIVERDQKAKVGVSTVTLLRELITQAKDAGANPGECDKLLTMFYPISRGSEVLANDALLIAGQLQVLIGPNS